MSVASDRLKAELLKEAERATHVQLSSGSMPAGRNGAYGHVETPVRNTSHWLFSFCNAYRFTSESRYESAAKLANGYLIACVEQFDGAVVCRLALDRDESNGVLGQAHVLEALYESWMTFHDRRALDAALSLAKRHRFDSENGIWKRVTPGGRPLEPDFTFNHQLYYAAVVSSLAEYDDEIRAQVGAFAANLTRTLRVRADGRIAHDIKPASPGLVSKAWSKLHLGKELARLAKKELNYHSYNLYAFALLQFNGTDFAQHVLEDWRRVLAFTDGPHLRDHMQNVLRGGMLKSGTETVACDLAYHRKARRVMHDQDVQLALDHLIRCKGPAGDYTLLSPDPLTQAARVYRYWRLLS